jgi:hydrogenase maturation protease
MTSNNNQNILIIGLGNILLSDEGVGAKVIDEFKRIYNVPNNIEMIDGGTLGIELFPYFQNRTKIIVVDAVQTGKEPGTIVKIKIPKNFSFQKTSSHQTSLLEVLNAAFLNGDELGDITVIGIQPENLKAGLSLSKNIEQNIGKLVDMIVEELDAVGIKVEPKSVCI